MKDEEDMLELLDDEGSADELELELDEPETEPEDEPVAEVEESEEESSPEPEGRELEIDIRLIIGAVIAIIALILAGVFVVMPMMAPSGPPVVIITPSQSAEDLSLFLESGPELNQQDVRFTIDGQDIPPDKLLLLGGASWPWSQGEVLKIDTAGYIKPATVAVVYTKNNLQSLLFSTSAEPTPTPTPTPTPEPTPEPVQNPVMVPDGTNMTVPVSGTPIEEPLVPVDLIRFDAEPTSGIQPLTVQFADQTTVCAQNRSWEFGDGLKSNTRYPEHTYPFPGTYTASLDMTFCDPDESSPSPQKEIVVMPMERQDTLLSGPGTAEIDGGGELFFIVKGPGMTMRIGGKDYSFEKDDQVRIVINEGGTGSISIINNAIVEFNFENASIFVNDKEFASGWLTNININQYSQIATTDITIRIKAHESGLKGLVNAIPSIVASNGQIIVLHNVGPDSTGKFLFSVQEKAGFTFRGGIESYEVTTPSSP